ESMLAKAFADLRRTRAPALALDLRGNGGGVDQYGALLCSYLLKSPFRYFDRIDVTEAYDGSGEVVDDADGSRRMISHSGLDQQEPSSPAFEGELFVLIDGGTFSTAADVAAVLHSQGRGIFLGEESGGGYCGNTSGASKTVTLPMSGITMDLPMWKYTTAVDSTANTGRGVPVEHRIVPTWARTSEGVDQCLEKVRALRSSR
ncbi:MAG: S41 family peptidase, partial [Planctomycetota bacterium]